MRIPGYTIDGPIGSGSDGVTWLGRDRHGEAVAVRLLREQHDSSPPDRRRLQRLQELRHPHLAEVMEVLTVAEGHLALVSEAVPGPTLATARISRGGFSAPEALGVGTDLASALAVMHEAQIVHGDVSPNNVVLVPRRGAVLVDLAGEPAAEGGTGDFAAPERRTGNLVSAGEDVYALARLVVWLGRGEDRDQLRERVGNALAPGPQDRCSMADLHHRLSEAKGAGVHLPAGPILAGAALRDHAQREETRRIGVHRPKHRREKDRRPLALAGAVTALVIGAGTWWYVIWDASEASDVEVEVAQSRSAGGFDETSVGEVSTTAPSDPFVEEGVEHGDAPQSGEQALADPVQAARVLTRARDRAINAGDAEALRALTVPGSSAAHGDADFAEALAAGHLAVEGLHTEVSHAETLRGGSRTAEGTSTSEGQRGQVPPPVVGDGQLTWVRVQLSVSEYVVTNGQGEQVHPADQRCAVLGLEPADTEWKVSRIESC